MTVILASSSPRRRALLARLRVPFAVVPSGVQERAPEPGEDPRAYALALARQKGDEVAGRFPGRVILAADTVVAVDDVVLGKPTDAADAARMLRMLRDRSHMVATAVVVSGGGVTRDGVKTATVRMRPYVEAEIERYVATGEPMDKAGGYAIQRRGAELIAGVRGCVTTVVGLPLCLAAVLLQDAGVHVPVAGADLCVHRDDLSGG